MDKVQARREIREWVKRKLDKIEEAAFEGVFSNYEGPLGLSGEEDWGLRVERTLKVVYEELLAQVRRELNGK